MSLLDCGNDFSNRLQAAPLLGELNPLLLLKRKRRINVMNLCHLSFFLCLLCSRACLQRPNSVLSNLCDNKIPQFSVGRLCIMHAVNCCKTVLL